MSKRIFPILFGVLSFIFFTCCEELNSPDHYMMIPGKIQITRVTYDDKYNYYIYMYWDNYKPQFTELQLTRDSKLIAKLSKDETSFIDMVQRGTYEYRLYAINGNIKSIASYIKIKVNTYDYEWWYE